MNCQNDKKIPEVRRKVLIVSDIDGTLVTDDERLPQANVEAIRKFTAMGGDFTIASGRRIQSLQILPGLPELTTKPILAVNGGWGYDYRNKKTIWAEFIPSEHYAPMIQAFERHPEVTLGIVSMNDEILHIRYNKYFNKWVNDEQLILREIATEEIPKEDMLKFAFCGQHEILDEIKKEVDWKSIDITPTYSAPFYLECSPTVANKADAIKRISEIYGIERERIIAVGDEMNDLSMIEYAGLGIAVDNAAPEVFDKADARCVSNNEGAIADVIEHYAIPLLMQQ